LCCAIAVDEVVALGKVSVSCVLGGNRTYCRSRDVAQGVEEEGPDENQVEECETEIVDEESNDCS
jgi:hypothetical protein